MPRRRTALAISLSLLPLAQPVLLTLVELSVAGVHQQPAGLPDVGLYSTAAAASTPGHIAANSASDTTAVTSNWMP
ncbi:hypothetical protein PMIT1327_01933 [Prochlorococcus marinus str. MIT 1327]|nr:hypothetical protein PMIT1312_02686 [Prochlorococcus marinus str. MIT 1312]KZR79870.1 hypothetical protein PMIT1327_01933 [Prochlorococcus marinus str. MIT 1327]